MEPRKAWVVAWHVLDILYSLAGRDGKDFASNVRVDHSADTLGEFQLAQSIDFASASSDAAAAACSLAPMLHVFPGNAATRCTLKVTWRLLQRVVHQRLTPTSRTTRKQGPVMIPGVSPENICRMITSATDRRHRDQMLAVGGSNLNASLPHCTTSTSTGRS